VIRTEEEYRVGLRRLDDSKRAIADTHAALLRQGLDTATIDMLLASMRALQQDVQEEVDAYGRARAFDFGPVPFAGLGRLLIGLCIARHMTVSDLADALDTDKGLDCCDLSHAGDFALKRPINASSALRLLPPDRREA